LAEGNGPDSVQDASPTALKLRSGPIPAGAVFISYASQDAVAAERIARALRAAEIEVWFDQSELRGGDAWDALIRRQIKTCALFMPLISKNTHARGEGYFRLEWKLAVDRSHLMASDLPFLLPVVVDDTPDQEDRVPDRFREVQWTRLPDGVTPAAFVERVRRLLSGLSESLPRTASQAPPVSAELTSRPHVLRSWRPKALLVIIALGVIALGYLAAHRPVLSRRLTEVETPRGPAAQNVPANDFNPPPHSIAVLPFVNMSGDPKQEYFSDGIAEELLNALSRLNDLQVMARTSSFSFKGKDVDISTIARKLNVGAVLEGSVRQDANTVRITVQLINAVNGFHLWSQTYDRKLTDILKVQVDVATSVAQQLEVKLVGDEAIKVEVGGTKNPEAYDAFLRGMQLFNMPPTKQSEYRAILREFDHAASLDPDYALALALRANALVNLWVRVKNPQLLQDALASAQRAVTVAPELGEAHADLAYARRWMLDMAGAGSEFERALALAPGSAKVQGMFGQFAAMVGHSAPALAAARRGVSLDPQSFWARKVLLDVLSWTRQFAEVPAAIQDAEALNPGYSVAFFEVNALLASGQFEQVRQNCESPAIALDEDDRHYCLALAYHALERQTDAVREFEKLKALDGDSPCTYASIYAQWGNKVMALQSLARAERMRSPCLQVVKAEWTLDPIRNEPQFKALEAHMNFPP
jgi:TolB-like protein/tetratricopeptide (TPR) repeat protein